MMFASCDPTVRIEDTLAACPYYQGTGRCTGMASCSSAQEPICITNEPSGGWESWVRAQYNEPNPILVWARKLGSERYGAPEDWFDAANNRAWDEAGRPGLSSGFDAHWAELESHALRVLSRLAGSAN